jgi:drug/metabolite transporter (DMT)-like permease
VFLGVVMLGEPVTANLVTSILLVTTGLLVVNGRMTGRQGKPPADPPIANHP